MLPYPPRPPPRRPPAGAPLRDATHQPADARDHAPPTLLHGAAIAIPLGVQAVSGLRFGDLADLGVDWGAFAIVLGRELRQPPGAGGVGDGGAMSCCGLQGRVLVRDAGVEGGILALIAHPQAEITAEAAARVVVIAEASPASAAATAAVEPGPAITATALVKGEDARGALWPGRPWRLRLDGAPIADPRLQPALAAWLGLPADAVEVEAAADANVADPDALDTALWAARATLLALKARLPVRLPRRAVAGRVEAP